MTATVSALEPKRLATTLYTELRNVRGLNDFERRTLAAIMARAMWREGYRRDPQASEMPVVGPGQQTIFDQEGA